MSGLFWRKLRSIEEADEVRFEDEKKATVEDDLRNRDSWNPKKLPIETKSRSPGKKTAFIKPRSWQRAEGDAR